MGFWLLGSELFFLLLIALLINCLWLAPFFPFCALLQITTDDLLQAAQIEERGMLDRKERSPEMWKRVAINEAAMAVVAVNFPDLKNIEFVWFSH